ncbi:MAG: hypothetical protein AB7D37_14820 [Desulfovibrio sp.]
MRWDLHLDVWSILDVRLLAKVAIPDNPTTKDPFWNNAESREGRFISLLKESPV